MSAILDVLSQRWSPRAFAPRAIEADKLTALFEAARWAPSCYNDQPWSFLIMRRGTDAAYEQLLATLMAANQAWAATAPVLVLNVLVAKCWTRWRSKILFPCQKQKDPKWQPRWNSM